MNILISATELKSRLQQGVILFDCRNKLDDPSYGPAAYKAGHLPGAYHLDLAKHLSGPVGPHGGRHPLPSPEQFTQTMRTAGVTAHSTVVLYDDSDFSFAARAWWLLRYFGHNNVLLLNGGFAAWKNENYPLDRREAGAKQGNFKASPTPEMIIERDAILAQQNQLTLIDARHPTRFSGADEPIDPVAGHIPGAINQFWMDSTKGGFFKAPNELRELWEARRADEKLVVYCGSGVTACVNIVSLMLAGKEARLYPGSWSDWCSYY